MDKQFGWIDFYTSLANKLLAYKNDRKLLIERIREVYNHSEISMPTLDCGGIPADIDPFTVFGLFNKGISEANRKAIISNIAEVFSINAEQPIGFDGIPVLNNLNATFYAFSNDGRRKSGDIDRLWALFEAALAYADLHNEENREPFIKAFDGVRGQFGLSWKLTMGLYWTRPYAFLNLDSRNRWYMEFPEVVSPKVSKIVKSMKSLPGSEEYLELTALVKSSMESGTASCSSLPELSYQAWVVSEKVNKENKEKERRAKRPTVAHSLGDEDVISTSYWLYAPGEDASMWNEFYEEGVMGLGWGDLGDLSQYATKENMRKRLLKSRGNETSQMNSALAVWQFSNTLKPGDVVYAKRGRSRILGRGLVESEYYYDENGGDYPNFRKVKGTDKGEWKLDEKFAMKTLTEVTDYQDFIAKTEALFANPEGDIEKVLEEPPVYTSENFLKEVYIEKSDYETLVKLLESKKNVILQGAPGVGKTFTAKRLAYSIMGMKDKSRVGFVQFHQSYSYEDFIIGYRPNEQGGFERRRGSFYNFCRAAADDSEREYFFIIDEINRGNLSKIFGELFMLIEADKRGPKYKLQPLYSDELFFIPENVRIIGTMNTADRSLAMLDYALRRRFAFFDLKPGFASDGFTNYRKLLNSDKLDMLIHCIEDLNNKIRDDESLGAGFCIGHSFFCDLTDDDIAEDRLNQIVNYEVVPLLREYWFDEPSLVREWEERLRDSIK